MAKSIASTKTVRVTANQDFISTICLMISSILALLFLERIVTLFADYINSGIKNAPNYYAGMVATALALYVLYSEKRPKYRYVVAIILTVMGTSLFIWLVGQTGPSFGTY